MPASSSAIASRPSIYKALSPMLGERIIAKSGSAPTLRVIVSGYREDRAALHLDPFHQWRHGGALDEGWLVGDLLSLECRLRLDGDDRGAIAAAHLEKGARARFGRPRALPRRLGAGCRDRAHWPEARNALAPRRAGAPSRARRARRPGGRALARANGTARRAAFRSRARAASSLATGLSFAIRAAAVSATRASAIATRCARMSRPASSPRAPRRRFTAYDTLSRGRRRRRHLHRPCALRRADAHAHAQQAPHHAG